MAAERAEALVLPGGDVLVPGGHAVLLLAVLRLYEAECRGVRRPVSTARPRMSPELRLLLAVVELAAMQDKARRGVVGASEVSVPHAAAMLRVTPGWVRQLLASGGLAGRRVGRMWLVNVASIERRMNG